MSACDSWYSFIQISTIIFFEKISFQVGFEILYWFTVLTLSGKLFQISGEALVRSISSGYQIYDGIFKNYTLTRSGRPPSTFDFLLNQGYREVPYCLVLSTYTCQF